MKRFSIPFFIFLFLFPLLISAQNPSIISGPFQGATTPQSTEVWMLAKDVDEVRAYSVKHKIFSEQNTILKALNDSLTIVKIKSNDVKSGIYDDFKIELKNNFGGTIETNISLKIPEAKVTDFTFLAGSCIWPFGRNKKKWNIFKTMENYPADFMMWMGDNIYLLKEEWNSKEEIDQKYIYYRTQPQLKSFLSKQPNFAAWDDHDFGPNNSESDFENKNLTFNAFKDFWANPSAGTDSILGTFYSFVWQDVEFFVLDGRYHRNETEMYGSAQMNWLKNGINQSNARIKFIVGGSQFLVHSGGEDWGDYPKEKNDFLTFIKKEKIDGIVFLSGDRHFAELTVLERENAPDLIEITASPLTSFVNPFAANKSNARIKGTLVKKRNFARIFLSSIGENRELKIELRGRKGQLFWSHEFLVDDLKWKK